jgi:hypothetical protein
MWPAAVDGGPVSVARGPARCGDVLGLRRPAAPERRRRGGSGRVAAGSRFFTCSSGRGRVGEGKKGATVQNLNIHRPHRYIHRLTDECNVMYIHRLTDECNVMYIHRLIYGSYVHRFQIHSSISVPRNIVQLYSSIPRNIK